MWTLRVEKSPFHQQKGNSLNILGCDSWGWKCCLLSWESAAIIKEATVWPPNTLTSASVIQSMHHSHKHGDCLGHLCQNPPAYPAVRVHRTACVSWKESCPLLLKENSGRAYFIMNPSGTTQRRHGSRAGTVPALTDLQSGGRHWKVHGSLQCHKTHPTSGKVLEGVSGGHLAQGRSRRGWCSTGPDTELDEQWPRSWNCVAATFQCSCPVGCLRLDRGRRWECPGDRDEQIAKSCFITAAVGIWSVTQSLCSVTQLCLTPCDPMDYIACQAPLSMGFSSQEYWSGLPLPPPEDLPDPWIESTSPALQAGSLPLAPPGKTIPKSTGSHLRGFFLLLVLGFLIGV